MTATLSLFLLQSKWNSKYRSYCNLSAILIKFSHNSYEIIIQLSYNSNTTLIQFQYNSHTIPIRLSYNSNAITTLMTLSCNSHTIPIQFSYISRTTQILTLLRFKHLSRYSQSFYTITPHSCLWYFICSIIQFLLKHMIHSSNHYLFIINPSLH